jgi:hypothetical protein
VIAVENGRAVVKCDHGTCSHRLDLGPFVGWDLSGRRLPSGWIETRSAGHWCPQHQLTLFPALAA